MADIPRQLAALLGRETVQIRKTDETPPRISVIDVAVAVTGKNAKELNDRVGGAGGPPAVEMAK